MPNTNSITPRIAAQLAQQEGGYLATITSAEENSFVFDLINSPAFFNSFNGSGPALGGRQQPGAPEPAGGWYWLSGEPWNYTNWSSDSPDNGGGIEDSLEFYSGMGGTPAPTWNDQPFDDPNCGGYVVERDDFDNPDATNSIYLRQTICTVAENANAASVVVLRTGPDHFNESVSVEYLTVDGTARAGLDYAAASGTLHFAPGETIKLISIPILNDALKESEEQFHLVLSNPTGGVALGNSNTIVRIQDNDPPFVFDATADFSITNGNPNGAWSYGWMPTDFSQFQLVGNPTADVNGDSPGWGDATAFFWKNLGGEAYGVPTGWLSLQPGFAEESCVLRWTAPVLGLVARIHGRFLAGDIGEVQVAVRMNGQAVWQAVDSGAFDLGESVEPGDTVDFVVYGGYWDGNTPIEAIISVTSVENAILIRRRSVTVAENANVVSVEVLRFGPEHLNEEVTVDYATVDETAHAGEDYGAVSGTLHFAAGETNKLITIPILNDALKESEEQFRLALSNPTGGVSLGRSNLVIQIWDDEPYYVNVANPNPVFPYTSWSTAATNIQDAVDAGTEPERVVLVTNGVYAVGRKFGGGPYNLYTYNRVVIPDSIRLASVNGPLLTTIEGGGRCVYLGSNAVLSGFTLTNGVASQGGGVFSEPSGIVTNCIVIGNASYGSSGGGGVSGGTLFNCILTNNVALHGRLEYGRGGAVSDAVLYNCTLAGNSADYDGGGASRSTLYNCTVTGNSATVGGGAYGSTLYNCTLAGNSAGWGGGASASKVFNSIVYSNSGGNYDGWTVLNFSCTTPLPTNGVGNIDADPRFVNYVGGNLRLRSNSPCIDTGTNLTAFFTTDLDGLPRPLDGNGDGVAHYDMGAYEFNPYRFEPTLQLSPEGFRFTVRGGEPGKLVRIERSRDLVHWEFAGQVPIPASGQTLIDPPATAEPQLFYRVIAVP